MAATDPVKILEICRVTPSDAPESATELSLPLTHFDIFWLKQHPTERIFFYELTDSTHTFFHSVIVAKLRASLSLTLLHFLPLAGNISWLPHAAKPAICYYPNDGVLVTVAESNADFTLVSGSQMREVMESKLYIQELPVSDSTAATIAFQITLFPNQGFSIGISSHHAIFDGKSVIMFMKAWAYICKQSETETNPSLLPELIPVLDRSLIQDPEGLYMIYLNNWLEAKLPGLNTINPKSLKLFQGKGVPPNSVRSTFELSREDIQKLRRKVIYQLEGLHEEDSNQIKSTHFSTFALSFAYTLVCVVKARMPERKRKIVFAFAADCRARLDPPIPPNYFGNCVKGLPIFTDAEALLGDDGVAFAAEKLSERIKGLEKGVISEREKERLAIYLEVMGAGGTAIGIGVAGSPRFEVYGTDFGWGKPKKVEITSIDREESSSIAESKDGSGGVEVGLVLKKHEMEKFDSVFVSGLRNL
ncbi:hypothetical protein GH714_043685 [Hevea brasiliensis]|uniref:Uncharacterized protein n=1 Tax=Hevea brasiliensis TaxID=3981 RepID=A0A6A6K5P1_HEVBR|nr:hypothetical protein GH714_043685 [Hevea brasiliensis]